ncbi:hypothetical protein ACIBI9_49055 [Nonomuraea sp. NPDC050451]|uniref:hypothetical protein n=1 Tax=Nonomuraea sp. NPDC050451 TaxID=3364364 RepID=UPI0037A918B4
MKRLREEGDPEETTATEPTYETKVRLVPDVILGSDQKITSIRVSPGQRTPTPFKNGRMGDHTISWQALVDGVLAPLHDLPFLHAVDHLRSTQEEAHAWSKDDTSDMGWLLSLIRGEPQESDVREPRLAMWHEATIYFLTGAKKSWEEAQKERDALKSAEALLGAGAVPDVLPASILDPGALPAPATLLSAGAPPAPAALLSADPLRASSMALHPVALRPPDVVPVTATPPAPLPRAVVPMADLTSAPRETDDDMDIDDMDTVYDSMDVDAAEELALATEKERRRANANIKEGEALVRLGKAVAHHLAYLNYLPFATVPADGPVSIGSSEGGPRQILIAYEKAHPVPDLPPPASSSPEAPEPVPVDADELREALWALFDLDAAERGAHVKYLADPTIKSSLDAPYKRLDDLSAGLGIPGILGSIEENREAAKATFLATSYVPPPKDKEEDKKVWEGLNKDIKRAEEEFRGNNRPVYDAVTSIRDVFKTIDAMFDKQKKGDRIKIWNCAYKAHQKILLAKQDKSRITTEIEHAAKRAKLALSALLEKHLRMVAAAYPASVQAAGFLSPSPEEAATERLKADLHTGYGLTNDAFKDDKPLGVLLGEVKKRIQAMPGLTPAMNNHWVLDTKRNQLVVTYKPGGELTVNGRAPAPAGVGGMGCHTTAWITQIQAVEQMLKQPKQLEALHEAVITDLKSDVMKLDALLPRLQLKGGQLLSVFNAASQVLKAGDVQQAAEWYLKFRNMLPFATVNAGDRGGGRERPDGTLNQVYDGTALSLEAELVQEEFEEKNQYKKSIKARRTAADVLESHIGDWHDHLKEYVKASALRLRDQADVIDEWHKPGEPRAKHAKTDGGADPEDKADSVPLDKVRDRIRSVRWKEHRRVFKLARAKR